ncbi:hypothetical protein D3C71_1530810 [compost metagenome]
MESKPKSSRDGNAPHSSFSTKTISSGDRKQDFTMASRSVFFLNCANTSGISLIGNGRSSLLYKVWPIKCFKLILSFHRRSSTFVEINVSSGATSRWWYTSEISKSSTNLDIDSSGLPITNKISPPSF